MAVITRVFTSIADAALNPDAPVTTTLAYALRDNIEFIEQWLGASYVGGAVQDHNHDGLNSAKIAVGPSLLRGGDFEDGLAQWTATQYAGGTVSANTASVDGAGACAITSTALASGGGDILSNEFIVCDGGSAYGWAMNRSASVAGVSSTLQAEFFDAANAPISTSVVQSDTSTPTAPTLIAGVVVAPAAARYMKMRAIGGVPNVGTAVGTVTFDSIFLTRAPSGAFIRFTAITASTTFTPTTATQTLMALIVGGGGAGGQTSGTVTGGGMGQAGQVLRLVLQGANIAASYAVTIGGGGGPLGAGGTTSFGAYSAVGGGYGQTATASGVGCAGENCVGPGGAMKTSAGAGNNAAANSGAGGGGAYTSSTANYNGGYGGSGVVYVWEFA